MRLEVVTYNIKSGIYHPDGLEAVARVLEETSAQVICLQEVDRDTRRARHVDQTAWLADRLGMPYYCFGGATPWEGGGEYGVGLISVFPLADTSVRQLWVPSGSGVPHGEREPRVLLSARLQLNGSGDGSAPDLPEVTVMVSHFGLTEEQRLRQARQVLERVREEDGRPVVVTGDFNCRPDSKELELLGSELKDVLDETPESERVTFPSGDPHMHGQDYLARTIDYILVKGGAEVVEARVIPEYSLASDHNPCVATLAVGDEP